MYNSKKYFKVVYNAILYFFLSVVSLNLFAQPPLHITANFSLASPYKCKGDTLIFNASTLPGNVMSNYYLELRDYSNSNVIASSTTPTLVAFGNLPASIYLYAQADSAQYTMSNGNPVQYTSSTIILQDAPTVDLGPNVTVCQGVSITIKNLSVPGVGSYLYQWSNGATVTSINTSIPAKYSLTVIKNDISACKTKRDITLSNYPNFQLNAGGTATKCANANLQLNAAITSASTSPYSFSWLPNNYFIGSNLVQSPTVNPASPTTYTVTGIDANNCKSVSLVSVSINPAMATNTVVQDTTLCKFVTISLPTNSSGGTPFSGSQPYKYSWKPKLGLNDSTLQNPSVYAVSVTGIKYKVTVTDAKNCRVSDSVIVKKVSLAMNFSPNVDSIALCSGGSKTFTVVTQNGTTPYTYTWSPLGILNKINETTYSTNKLYSDSKIVAMVTDKNGCTDKDSVKIGIIPLPQPNLGGSSQNICVGTTLGIDATPSGKNPADYKFKWSPAVHVSNVNIPNPIFSTASLDSTIKYFLSITSVGTGCINKDSITLSTKAPTTVKIIPPATDIIYINVAIDFSTDAPQGMSLVWKFQDYDILETAYTVSHTFDSVKTYKVNISATNSFGCTSYDSINVATRRHSSHNIYIPNVFSPASSDSRNSAFKVFAEATDLNTENFKISIFNIFGSQVFTSDSFTTMRQTGWTGEGYTPGVYTYVVKGEFADGTGYNRTGTVTMLR